MTMTQRQFTGMNYIPSRQEIRRYLQVSGDHAEDMVASGELKPELVERWVWSNAVRLARWVDTFNGLQGRWI